MNRTGRQKGPDGSRGIARPPGTAEVVGNRAFIQMTRVFAGLTIVLLGFIVWQIGGTALPAIERYGIGFLASSDWDVANERFGILPQLWGTVYSSALALLLAGLGGVVIAIFLTQDFLWSPLDIVFRYLVELLAAVPSVVYGLWGIHVLIPAMRPVAAWLHAELGWIPFFGTQLNGPGLLPAALVLAIMVLPTVAALSIDALQAVPRRMKEAAYGLGATRWEAVRRVILPAASVGIFGAMVLGLGRALGETMALAMLVGNANHISLSLFAPANSLAAALALNFPEAGEVETQALMYAAVVLLLVTLAVNLAGAAIITRAVSRLEGRN